CRRYDGRLSLTQARQSCRRADLGLDHLHLERRPVRWNNISAAPPENSRKRRKGHGVESAAGGCGRYKTDRRIADRTRLAARRRGKTASFDDALVIEIV